MHMLELQYNGKFSTISQNSVVHSAEVICSLMVLNNLILITKIIVFFFNVTTAYVFLHMVGLDLTYWTHSQLYFKKIIKD